MTKLLDLIRKFFECKSLESNNTKKRSAYKLLQYRYQNKFELNMLNKIPVINIVVVTKRNAILKSNFE